MQIRRDQLGLVRLSEDECWQVLARHNIGRIAVVQHGRPFIFPVNFAIHEGTLVFRTAPGTKLTAATLSAEVAFEVDEASALFDTGTSVMVHGQATLVPASERAGVEALRIRPWAPGARDEFVRITPRWISGRRIPNAPLDADGQEPDGG